MLSRFRYFLKDNSYRDRSKDIDPDEIFLDSENLPKFDTNQFEGRIEKSISRRTFFAFGIVCVVMFMLFFFKSFSLQVMNGAAYLAKSENNRLKNTLLFSKRGIITDRNDEKLAWNVASESSPEFSLRKYADIPGLAHVVGYVKYPLKDSSGFYYDDTLTGKDGIEKSYNDTLSGENGLRIVEVDARGAVQSESVIRPPVDGKDTKLSIDAKLTEHLYTTISDLANKV